VTHGDTEVRQILQEALESLAQHQMHPLTSTADMAAFVLKLLHNLLEENAHLCAAIVCYLQAMGELHEPPPSSELITLLNRLTHDLTH